MPRRPIEQVSKQLHALGSAIQYQRQDCNSAMADFRAFAILVPRDSLPEFVTVLAAHLAHDTPRSVRELFAASRTGNGLTFPLKFTWDSALAELPIEPPAITCSVPGQALLGSLFVTARELAERLENTLAMIPEQVRHAPRGLR